MARDSYQLITDRIIAELEKGEIPWDKPWTGRANGPISHRSGEAYSLLNQMLLRKPGEYITYQQALAEGGHVKKGEHGHTIYLWKLREVQGTSKDGSGNGEEKEEKKVIPFLKTITVFHIDQCDGIQPRWAQGESRPHADIVEAGEAVIREYKTRTGLRIDHIMGDEASYSPALDRIRMPLREQFTNTAEYYSTLFHESVHSTGHPSRLNRFNERGNGGFGSESYSKEELVAELGASILCHDLGIETNKSFRNTAAYIQSWIGALRNDKTLIVSAAGKADKAVNMIYGLNKAIERDINDEPAPEPVVVEPVTHSVQSLIDNADAKRVVAATGAKQTAPAMAVTPGKPKFDFPKGMSPADRIKAIEEYQKANAVQRSPERSKKRSGPSL